MPLKIRSLSDQPYNRMACPLFRTTYSIHCPPIILTTAIPIHSFPHHPLPPPFSSTNLVNINTLGPQISLGQLDLLHQLGVRVGRVAEGEHAPAEADEQPGAERDEEPEGELSQSHNCLVFGWSVRAGRVVA